MAPGGQPLTVRSAVAALAQHQESSALPASTQSTSTGGNKPDHQQEEAFRWNTTQDELEEREMSRRDGSLKLSEQWEIFKAGNRFGGGYTMGDCLRSNAAALRSMFGLR